MNKTKIEWTNYTWSPITGCKHGCWYCWANRMFTRFHKSFEPTFHPERMNELKKLKKPAKIFVCSVSDLFAPWIRVKWRNAVLNEILKPEYSHLTFQLLTKHPEGILADFQWKKNIWIGVTITQKEEIDKMFTLIERYSGLKFLSFEPLLGPISLPALAKNNISWIIIGKLTGNNKIKLEKEWVENLIKQTREFKIPLFLKNNLRWPEKIQEFPS